MVFEKIVRIFIEFQQKGMKQAGSSANDAGSAFSFLGKNIMETANRFQAWMMSVMFGGMMIKRAFESLAITSMKTFTDIMTASDNAGTAIGQFNAQWEYLKFTIGDAINRFLEPLIPIIEKIVGGVTKWIREHEKLTAGIILVGILVGGLLFLFGSLGLFTLGVIKGISSLIDAFYTALPALTAFGSAIDGAVLSLAAFLHVSVGMLAVIAIILTFIILLGTRWHWNLGMMGTEVGIWVREVVKWVMQLYRWILEGLGSMLDSVINMVGDAVVGLFNNTIRPMINNAIKGINSIFGTNIGQLGVMNKGGTAGLFKNAGSGMADLLDALINSAAHVDAIDSLKKDLAEYQAYYATDEIAKASQDQQNLQGVGSGVNYNTYIQGDIVMPDVKNWDDFLKEMKARGFSP
jgi:hypothetical protein